MPRFFFHIDDGSFSADPLGSDLADLGKAQEAAVTMSGEIIRDKALSSGPAAAVAPTRH
jgi:hypothetical protein